MFTGLVEQLGRVMSLEALDKTESGGGGCALVVCDAGLVLSDAALGDSIAVNGK